MRFSAPKFERRLRRLARREIRGSDELRRQWRAQHSIWKQLFDQRPSRGEAWGEAGIGVLLAFGIVTMILAIAPAEAHANPQIGPATAARLALATPCLLITGLALMILTEDRATFHLNHLGVYACLPVDDHRLVQSKCGMWLFMLSLLTYVAILPLLLLLNRHRIAGEALQIGLLLVILQWLVTLSCGLLASAYASPTNPLVFPGVALILAGAGLPFVSPLMPGWLASLIGGVLYLTPPGWVDAALVHGLLEGNAAAWWFLTPALGVVVRAVPLAIERVRARFAFREFHCHGLGSWLAILATGFRVPEGGSNFWLFDGTEAPDEELTHWAQLREQEAIEEVRRGDFLRLSDAQPATIRGRLTRRLLSDREQAIAASVESSTFEYHHERSGLGRWWKGLPTLGLLLALLWTLSLVRAFRGEALVVGIGLLPLYLGARWADSSKANLVGQLPVTLEEMGRVKLRQESVRTLVLLPLLLGYGVTGVWIVDAPLWHGVIVGGFLGAFRVCLQPALACAAVARATGLFQQPVFCIGWYALQVAPIVAVAFKLRVEDASTTVLIAAAAGFLTAPFALSWYSVRSYNRGRFDLVVRQREE